MWTPNANRSSLACCLGAEAEAGAGAGAGAGAVLWVRWAVGEAAASPGAAGWVTAVVAGYRVALALLAPTPSPPSPTSHPATAPAYGPRRNGAGRSG